MERMNRQELPDSPPTNGNSCTHQRQVLSIEPANLSYQTGKNCALSVSDQLPDKSLVIRVNFSEIDRDSIGAISIEQAAA